MSGALNSAPIRFPTVKLPTEDDLPYSDGDKLESQRHVLQMTLLIRSLAYHWADRNDFFVGGDMFLHFNAARTWSFRGPDVFVVLDVPRRERKSWVVWQEGKGPDAVIELVSERTWELDLGEKKRIYQDELRVPNSSLDPVRRTSPDPPAPGMGSRSDPESLPELAGRTRRPGRCSSPG